MSAAEDEATVLSPRKGAQPGTNRSLGAAERWTADHATLIGKAKHSDGGKKK